MAKRKPLKRLAEYFPNGLWSYIGTADDIFEQKDVPDEACVWCGQPRPDHPGEVEPQLITPYGLLHIECRKRLNKLCLPLGITPDNINRHERPVTGYYLPDRSEEKSTEKTTQQAVFEQLSDDYPVEAHHPTRRRLKDEGDSVPEKHCVWCCQDQPGLNTPYGLFHTDCLQELNDRLGRLYVDQEEQIDGYRRPAAHGSEGQK